MSEHTHKLLRETLWALVEGVATRRAIATADEPARYGDLVASAADRIDALYRAVPTGEAARRHPWPCDPRICDCRDAGPPPTREERGATLRRIGVKPATRGTYRPDRPPAVKPPTKWERFVLRWFA